MSLVLVDTGPLVAILSRNDEHHKRCLEAMGDMRPPLYCCWPVLTEAAWLLRTHPRSVSRLLETVNSGLLHLLPLGDTDAEPIAAILRLYERIRPQLADAALVHLARREHIDAIFTLDRRDFSVYRGEHNRPFRLLPEIL